MSWVFQRGEDIRVLLEAEGAVAADLVGITVTAELKAAKYGRAPVGDAPAALTFTVTAAAEQAGIGAGWMLTAPAALTADLAPGGYVTNAVLTFPGDGVEKTDALAITIEPAA